VSFYINTTGKVMMADILARTIISVIKKFRSEPPKEEVLTEEQEDARTIRMLTAARDGNRNRFNEIMNERNPNATTEQRNKLWAEARELAKS
jgi:hypothetical protein